jgi:hypothetical protein
MFAYAGTFTVDAEKVVHHINISWNQSWTGTGQIGFLRLEGDRFIYVGALSRNPTTGRDCVNTVVFQRPHIVSSLLRKRKVERDFG